jgi:DNA-binding XRE family transcriptional regulator
MARNVNDLIDSLPATRRRKIEKRAHLLISEEMTLQELRRAREMTQVKMARSLGVAQKQISDIEKRTDMHISTLRRQVEALGGELTLMAKFPTGSPVKLKGLTEGEAGSKGEKAYRSSSRPKPLRPRAGLVGSTSSSGRGGGIRASR